MGKKTKQFWGKVKGAIKQVGIVVGDAALLPIMPLIIPMKTMLKKGGFAVPKGNRKIVQAFYENIVKKHKSFDEQRSNLVEDIVQIVKDIIEFFKNSGFKFKNKENITPEEKDAFILGNQVATAPAPQPQTEVIASKGISTNTIIIIGALAVAVIAFVVMRKK